MSRQQEIDRVKELKLSILKTKNHILDSLSLEQKENVMNFIKNNPEDSELNKFLQK